MGTAAVQGELWGAKAQDWSELQEPRWRPLYDMLLRRAGVGANTRLLDIGCGAGGALLAGRDLGAELAGLDASENLVAVARKRLPAADIKTGEMEELPFADTSFDVVTSFNAFQFAGNIDRAVGEARRVLKPGGKVAMLIWGSREYCELISGTLSAVMSLLPPPPPGAPSPLALSDPGVMEEMLDRCGFASPQTGDVDFDLTFPDRAIALRAIVSAGILVRAMRQLGEEKVKETIAGTFGKFTRGDGSVTYKNRLRWALARRP